MTKKPPARLRSPLLAAVSAAIALGLVAAACEHERAGVHGRPIELLPAVALRQALVFVERATPTAFVIDPSDSRLRPRLVPLAPDPAVAVRRAGGAADEALVLCRGERGEPGVAPQAASLVVVPALTGEPVRRYVLGSRFNTLAQTEDGRFAIAHFRRDAALGSLLFNPNEIAVVDLTAEPSESNPIVRTVRSFGGVPTGVVFSPPIALSGKAPRTLAVVLSETYLTLLDLANLDRPEITVPLTRDARPVRPVEVLFDDAPPALYVRSEASDDIHVILLAEVPRDEPAINDFRPSISQVAVGRGPTDMALYGLPDLRRLLVVAPGSSDASVVDIQTSRVTRVPLDVAANRILLFDSVAPGETVVRPRALLLAVGTGAGAAGFLDLDGIESRLGRNLDTRSMASPVTAVIPRLDRNLVIALHQAAAGVAGISLIDLGRRTTAPILAEVPLGRAAYGDNAARLWIAPERGERLGFLDLETFQPGEVRLDAPVSAVIPMDDAGLVAVLHPGFGGYLTVLDATEPRRETARSVTGFLLTDLLERGAE